MFNLRKRLYGYMYFWSKILKIRKRILHAYSGAFAILASNLTENKLGFYMGGTYNEIKFLTGENKI